MQVKDAEPEADPTHGEEKEAEDVGEQVASGAGGKEDDEDQEAEQEDDDVGAPAVRRKLSSAGVRLNAIASVERADRPMDRPGC